MKIKKTLSIVFVLICSFFTVLNFTSCETIMQRRQERKEALLAIQGVGEHLFIDEEGIIDGNTRVYFSDLILDKIETDGIISVPKPEHAQTKRYATNVALHKDTAYFTMRYSVSEDEKQADVILGYIHIYSREIAYFNVHISTHEEYGIDLLPNAANDNYFIFKKRFYNEYYVLNRETNVLIENIATDEMKTYKNGTENDALFLSFNNLKYEIVGYFKDGANVLQCGETSLTIDYDYVLARSEEMQKIDEIMSSYTKSTRSQLLTYNNRLYVVLESDLDMFGTGELIPVVFEYHLKTDSFTYIGATDLTWRNNGIYIFGILPKQ